MTFRLTQAAEQDIIDIYIHGLQTFGPDHADAYHDKLENTFQLLAERPHLARQRPEIDPPVRVHPCGSHVVIYTVGLDRGVLIIRVRHGREDWMADPEGR
ncbi:MAG: type II toxin-antitoxin system RelE/ParE family toxin [Inquilinaceae bacterium]